MELVLGEALHVVGGMIAFLILEAFTRWRKGGGRR